jgi:hypothetical protein
MIYTIIEDCSPYYIRFTFNGLQEIIDFVKNQPTQLIRKESGYSHEHYSIDVADNILAMLPLASTIKFRNQRAALFNTPPGGGCGIHKDGGEAKVSFNIPIEISDSACLTHWYSDDSMKGLPINLAGGYSKNVWANWKDLSKFTPAKTMTANPGEMLMFNTNIYHCWDNGSSLNSRKMLTLRVVDTSLQFNDWRKIIFK